jgi:DNA-binding response OmpR family regulator
MKILMIENEEKLTAKLSRLLKKSHFQPCPAFDAEKGLEEAVSKLYDAVILDFDLPGGGGLELLKKIRRANLSVPILVLSPKCGVLERVRALDSGADDFLEKPFADAELIARLRAVSRRKGELILNNQLTFAGLCLDSNTYILSSGGNHVPLSNKEYEIMNCFILHGHNIVNKEDFLSRIWGLDNSTAVNNLDVYISYLRRKLKQIHSEVQIRCMKNVGYYLTSTEQKSDTG